MEIETAIDSGKGAEICQAQRDVSHKYWSFLIQYVLATSISSMHCNTANTKSITIIQCQ